MRYSGLALSEVSPYPISHDSISRWLHDKCFRPRDLWEIAHKHVDSSEPSLLILSFACRFVWMGRVRIEI